MYYFVKERDRAPAATQPIPANPSLPRTCVIGAGSSGLAAVKALHQAAVPVDCFEQGSVVGGNWVFKNPNGQSACYETLEINTSCPRMAFSDFPMPADYPAYARHDQVAAYFEAYVDHFGFRDKIRFNTRVDAVVPENGGWRVETTGPEGTRQHHYDGVLVANGHHWDARWPDPAYPGSFDGEQLHAHDYRSAKQLRDKNVVVVGAGNSALDIASEAARVARSAILSQRRGQWVLRKYFLGRASDQLVLPKWLPWWATRARLRLASMLSGSTTRLGLPQPAHAPGQSHPVQSEQIRRVLKSGAVTPKPGIERLDGGRVVFTDGSAATADLIIWATGYRVRFPFLAEDLVSPAGNEFPLWKRTVHPDHPGLFFIGLLQPIGAVMPLAEAQSVWVSEMLTGRYVAPEAEVIRTQMERDHQRNARRFYSSARHTMEVDFDSYLWDLERERRRGGARAAKSSPEARHRLGAAA
ncbi:MAG: NAD(P)-binding domain-containing protein [Micrococcaceae bacterium]|nr:NAD(P)-binding domain-containing protein [Micrococcaceae bacterium]